MTHLCSFKAPSRSTISTCEVGWGHTSDTATIGGYPVNQLVWAVTAAAAAAAVSSDAAVGSDIWILVTAACLI